MICQRFSLESLVFQPKQVVTPAKLHYTCHIATCHCKWPRTFHVRHLDTFFLSFFDLRRSGRPLMLALHWDRLKWVPADHGVSGRGRVEGVTSMGIFYVSCVVEFAPPLYGTSIPWWAYGMTRKMLKMIIYSNLVVQTISNPICFFCGSSVFNTISVASLAKRK